MYISPESVGFITMVLKTAYERPEIALQKRYWQRICGTYK